MFQKIAGSYARPSAKEHKFDHKLPIDPYTFPLLLFISASLKNLNWHHKFNVLAKSDQCQFWS